MANRLFVVGFLADADKRDFFGKLFQGENWSDWEISLLDHTHRPTARSRPDFFPAHYFQHDDYIRDRKWILKAGLKMAVRCPRVSLESLILDFFVARRKEGFDLGILEAVSLVLRGFGTVSAKLMYGRSLGLEVSKGDCVVLFGSNHPTQRLFKAYCETVGSRLVMVEHGSLTGTVHFSPESVTYGLYPMRFSEAFRSRPVFEPDRAIAKRFLAKVEKGKVDQKPQRVDWDLLKRLRSKEGKTLLLPGTGNVGGGLYPRMSETSKRVSPFFRSNEHLLQAVLRIARRNGWTVVYKPHPNLVGRRKELPVNETLILCEECSIPELIRECDGIVCLGTKVSQTALAMGKPVVLAGLYSLSGMRCCYELENKGDLERNLVEALEQGLADSQKTAYLEYVARELRYCLFQYKLFTKEMFGRDLEDLSDSLISYFEEYRDSSDERYGHSLIASKDENEHY